MEEELRLLYYVWASTSDCEWCDFMARDTCYASGVFCIVSIVLAYRHSLLELNEEDPSSVRLTQAGRDLILKLGC